MFVAIRLIIQMVTNALNYCVNSSICHFKFPKVVQKFLQTLGEVGILGTVLLRVSSGTILTIFIEIGSHLTDVEQKDKLAQFFLRHGVFLKAVKRGPSRLQTVHCTK